MQHEINIDLHFGMLQFSLTMIFFKLTHWKADKILYKMVYSIWFKIYINNFKIEHFPFFSREISFLMFDCKFVPAKVI